MFAPFALTLVLLATSAPVPKDVAPLGPAPLVCKLEPNPDGKVMVTIRREEKRKVAVAQGGAINPNGGGAVLEREITLTHMMLVELPDVKDLQVYTAGGRAVDTKDALAKIRDGAVVIMTTDGKRVDPNFLRVFKDDTLVLVSPELVGTARPNPATGRPGRAIAIQPILIQPLPAVPADK